MYLTNIKAILMSLVVFAPSQFFMSMNGGDLMTKKDNIKNVISHL